MTKFVGFVAALVAALGVTLATPDTSDAGPFRFRRSQYVQSSYSPAVVYGNPSGPVTVAPGFSGTYYYQTSPGYSSGYYPSRGGIFSGYYRVGNVIINGRRWGDIGYRYSNAELIRW